MWTEVVLVHASAAVWPQLVLKQSDMPRGFRAGIHREINNRLDAVREGVRAKQLSRHGRIGGYEVSFGRYVTAGNGLVIDSVVSELKSSAEANWYYRLLVRHAVHNGGSTLPVPSRIGNEAVATSVGSIAYTITFRRGRYVASVTEAATSTRLKVPSSDVTRYAHLVDQRIQLHG